MFDSVHEIQAFIGAFEACTLPKPQWTHHAHLLVALCYLRRHSFDEALGILRTRIRAYNDSVGTPNTDNSGYHETLTSLFLQGVQAHITGHNNEPLPMLFASLLHSPLCSKEWPLRFYSHAHLTSVAARHHWVEPDVQPFPFS